MRQDKLASGSENSTKINLDFKRIKIACPLQIKALRVRLFLCECAPLKLIKYSPWSQDLSLAIFEATLWNKEISLFAFWEYEQRLCVRACGCFES